MTLRVVLVGPSNLGPYHRARYQALAERGLDLHVVRCPLKEHDRPWTFDASALAFQIDAPFGEKATGASRMELLQTARSYMERLRPHATVFIGYNSPYLWAMAAAARLRGLPRVLVLIGGAEGQRKGLRREAAKIAICRALFSAAMVPGVRARDYARTLGIPGDHIWRVGNVIDNPHFAADPASPRDPAFIYVGRLSPEKNLPRLLEAHRRYRAGGGAWGLRIVGDGPERGALEPLGGDGVEWLGWADYQTVPGHLAAASAFVIPSTFEPWGLVVNEAMAAGLPVLVSQYCGCYPELCREGVNGFGFEPTRPDEIAAAMSRLSRLPAERRLAVARASVAMVGAYTIDSWGTGFLNCVEAEAG